MEQAKQSINNDHTLFHFELGFYLEKTVCFQLIIIYGLRLVAIFKKTISWLFIVKTYERFDGSHSSINP